MKFFIIGSLLLAVGCSIYALPDTSVSQIYTTDGNGVWIPSN